MHDDYDGHLVFRGLMINGTVMLGVYVLLTYAIMMVMK